MVLSVLRGLGKAYLKNQAKTIKSVAPFSKTGGKTVEEWKKTADEIYNSTTWKLASKFTGGQTKRKKN